LLLDEIEKAHPDVWNVFLQVFDAGRLTDSRGDVADFSECVVIMTSNLGTGATERKSVGFAVGGDDTAHQGRVLEVVHSSMRPELLNRLDSIIVFRPLTPGDIRNITLTEINRLRLAIAQQGYVIVVNDDVIDHVANAGYNEHFGARHVHRAIEHQLLESLAVVGPGHWHAELSDASVAWHPVAGHADRPHPPAAAPMA
jgi:ATP-dependent Clp protease ATP-binding subunit ClpA